VLDIGAGNGILSLLAVQAGARRVFAVEPADVIQLARELAAANGYADRITFIQGLSSEIDLPERADVIVSDLRGVLPVYKAHIPAIIEARQRHLADGGLLIPLRDTLRAAPVQLADHYEEKISSWDAAPCGLNIAAGRAFAANRWTQVQAPADALLAAPVRLGVLDYPSIASPDISEAVEMEATQSGRLHGVVVWFDTELAEKVAFTNAPGEPETIYGQGFFPALEPVELESGDVISFALSASLIDGDYIFRWDTRVAGTSAPKAAFTQSTLFSTPFTPETLGRHRDAG
jgi:protein arginine N-methyltransferase 1